MDDIKIICDVCKEPARRWYVISPTNTTGQLDLCPTHEAPVIELCRHGKRVPGPPRTGTRARTLRIHR